MNKNTIYFIFPSIVFGIFLIFLLHIDKLAFTQTSVGNMIDFVDTKDNIKFQYPFNWIKVEANQTSTDNLKLIVMLKIPETNNTNHSISSVSVHVYNGSVPIIQFVNTDLFNLNRPELHVHLISKNITNFAENNATQIVFTYQTQSSNHKVLKIYEENSGQIYIFTFNTNIKKYDYYMPIIQKILSSFEISKKSNS